MVKVGFWINDPSKTGNFHQHWEKLAETLQIEDLAVKNVFLFYYVHIFVKKSKICIKKKIYEWREKNEKHFVEKSFSVFEGAPLSPSNTL